MKVLAIVCLLAVAASASVLNEANYELLFTKWMDQHGKAYSNVEEFTYRYGVFKNNMDYILNFPKTNPDATFTVAMNHLGDLTRAEFKAQYLGYAPQNRTKNYKRLSTVGLPSSVDWRTQGAVTPVKNQGQCGSCWAFSTTGSTEGAWFIAKGQLISLSEQELVDCSSSAGNEGCSGGLMDNAFTWIIQNGGICSEASYPYQGADGTCQTCTSVVTLSSYTDVTPQDDNALMAAVAQQPVSVAVEADQSYWQFYEGGVVSDPGCGTNLDHGVLIVGYGTDSGTNQPYWIVKNSWGASWGEQGYIRLVRGQDECGINSDPSYPVV